MKSATRDPFYDVVRAFAMLMVIVFHYLKRFSPDFCAPYAINAIEGTNMPLFFMISGILLSKYVKAGNVTKLLNHVRSYIVPMLWVSAIVILPSVIRTCSVNLGKWALIFFDMNWFLWTLAVCYSIAFAVARTRHEAAWWFAIYIVLLFVPDIWFVRGIKAMIPFFLFGVYYLSACPIWRKDAVGIVATLIYVLAVAFEGDIRDNGLSFYSVANTMPLWLNDGLGFAKYVLMLMNGVAGSVALLWMFDKILHYVPFVSHFSVFGTTTLGVYVLHEWMLNRIPAQRFHCVVTIFATVAIYLVCHSFTYYSMKLPLVRRWIWGK